MHLSICSSVRGACVTMKPHSSSDETRMRKPPLANAGVLKNGEIAGRTLVEAITAIAVVAPARRSTLLVLLSLRILLPRKNAEVARRSPPGVHGQPIWLT